VKKQQLLGEKAKDIGLPTKKEMITLMKQQSLVSILMK
jgi:hypothetical protein